MLLSYSRPILNVSDMERSLAFYRDLLGMKVVVDRNITDPRPGSEEFKVALEKAFNVANVGLRWVQLEGVGEGGAGRIIELMQWLNPKPQPLRGRRNCYDTGFAWCAFRVEGLRVMYDQLVSQGVKFLAPIGTYGSGRGFCLAIDPDGYLVQLGGTL